jgi:hypothetical protein
VVVLGGVVLIVGVMTGSSTGSDAPPAAFQLNGADCQT